MTDYTGPGPQHAQDDVLAEPTTTLVVPAPDTDADTDRSAKERAGDAADATKQAASEVASTASGKAQDVAEETKQQARNVLGEARTQVQEQTATQQRNLAVNLRSLGDELRSMADRSEHSGYASSLVGQAGERAHDAASWLDGRDPDQVIDEVRRFARRQPGAFVLGALAAGVLAGRLTRGVVATHQSDSDPTGPRA